MAYQSDGFKGIQYKRIGKMEGEKIIKKMDKYSSPKAKTLLGMLSGQPKSLAKFHKEVKERLGREVAGKFEEAAEKHFGGGVTEKQKRRNVKSTMDRDASYLDEQESRYKKIKYSALGDVSSGAKGQASDIGINRPNVGFASGTPSKTGFGSQSGIKPVSPAKPAGAPPIIPLAK